MHTISFPIKKSPPIPSAPLLHPSPLPRLLNPITPHALNGRIRTRRLLRRSQRQGKGIIIRVFFFAARPNMGSESILNNRG